MMIFSINF